MRTVHIRDLRRIEKYLLDAEDELANFRNCPADLVVSSAEEACSKIENARDILLEILEPSTKHA